MNIVQHMDWTLMGVSFLDSLLKPLHPSLKGGGVAQKKKRENFERMAGCFSQGFSGGAVPIE